MHTYCWCENESRHEFDIVAWFSHIGKTNESFGLCNAVATVVVMLAVNHNFNNLMLAQMCYELKCNHTVQVCMEEQLQITVFVNSLHSPFLHSGN